MRKQLWGMVGAVVVVMAAASFLNSGTARRARVTRALDVVGANVEWTLRHVPLKSVALATGGLVLLGGVVQLARRRRRPKAGFAEPWRTVIELGKQGRSASAIAQATGLSHDAVRIVLAPVAVDPSLSRGKSFRSAGPSAEQGPPGDAPQGGR